NRFIRRVYCRSMIRTKRKKRAGHSGGPVRLNGGDKKNEGCPWPGQPILFSCPAFIPALRPDPAPDFRFRRSPHSGRFPPRRPLLRCPRPFLHPLRRRPPRLRFPPFPPRPPAGG